MKKINFKLFLVNFFVLITGMIVFNSVSAQSTPSASIMANPLNVALGETTTITWTISGYPECFITHTNVGETGYVGKTVRFASGSETKVLQKSATFSMYCENQELNHVFNQYVTVNISSGNVPPPAKPVVTIAAQSPTIQSGKSSSITWKSTGATSCSAVSPAFWTTKTDTSGTQSVFPTATTTYSMKCTGTKGDDTKSVMVTVGSSTQDCTTNPPPAGCKTNPPPQEPVTIENPISVDNINDFFKTILEGALKIAIPIIALAIIYCGFLFVSAQGKPEELKKAKSAFMYTVIGAAILLGAWAIAQVISETVLAL